MFSKKPKYKPITVEGYSVLVPSHVADRINAAIAGQPHITNIFTAVPLYESKPRFTECFINVYDGEIYGAAHPTKGRARMHAKNQSDAMIKVVFDNYHRTAEATVLTDKEVS